MVQLVTIQKLLLKFVKIVMTVYEYSLSTGVAVAQLAEQFNPGFSSPHVKVSLGKILNPKLPTMCVISV